MSRAAFPINDLLRRKLQTSLIIATLTLSVASTLFLLLFSSRLGFGLTSATNILTLGLTVLFSQFILFIAILIFAVGVVLTSFIAFFMMAQRTRDFGLLKAAGCPNSLVGGYFMTELLTTTLAGCVLGIIVGFVMDYGIASIVFSAYTLPDLWFAPLVFVIFFVLASIFGLWPILKASKMSPITALSPVTYYGLTSTNKHKAISKSKIMWSIASRSMLRRQSATFRMVILLSIVFIMLTVAVAGGVIASGTTTEWIQNSTGKNTIAIATNSMGNQYTQLLGKFSGGSITSDFNYSDSNLAIPSSVIMQLSSLPIVSVVDTRQVLNGQIQEVGNFSFGETSGQTTYIGGNRTGDSLVIGVNPDNLVGIWSTEGRFLNGNDQFSAVVGDSIVQSMYSPDAKLKINQSDPLVEGLRFQDTTFNIVGVVVDPLNNGFVTYVPLSILENVTGISSPNLLLVTLKSSIDQSSAINQIKSTVQSIDPKLNVFPLNSMIEKDTSFLASNWQTIMILPLFSLASAALCLVGYMMLAVDEQRQEFAVLRAVGVKPRVVIFILTIQILVVLLSSFGLGISFGTIITLLILMPQPLVTSFSILEITGLLFAAFAGMFLLSLYPAFRFAKSSILKIMT